MTSAARPTFLPAVGGHSISDTRSVPTNLVRAKEQRAYTRLKLRADDFEEDFHATPAELKRKLEARERERALPSATGLLGPGPAEDPSEAAKRRRIIQSQNIDADDSDDGSDSDDDGSSVGKRKQRTGNTKHDNKDANGDIENDDDDDDDSDDSDSDDDEDDTAELMRELDKIKRERAEEQQRLDQERLDRETRDRETSAMSGNPLLQQQDTTSVSSSASVAPLASFTIKRRWDDDVIFKNQARGVDERRKKNFVNDMLRSDFHRKFMAKYMR